jgi:hypothetical protein
MSDKKPKLKKIGELWVASFKDSEGKSYEFSSDSPNKSIKGFYEKFSKILCLELKPGKK